MIRGRRRARRPTAMHAEDLPATAAPAPEPGRRTLDWGAALALQAAVSAGLGVATTAIWAVTGGGSFWPMWVWLGLALPLAVQFGVRRAMLSPAGRQRGLAVHAALFAVLTTLLLLLWLMSGMGSFWPIWPLTAFSIALLVHAWVVTQMLPPERERELADRVDVLTRTRRGALDVQAAELRRIERDLHDGAQARLVALSMQLGRAEDRLEDHPEAAELVRNARVEASNAIKELRDLARGIAPPVLTDRGLPAAVESLGERSALPVKVDARLTRRLSPVVESAAYFVVAESLTNAAKHARGAAARVSLIEEGGRLIVEIDDDGPGGADPHGSGLAGL